MDGFVQSAVEFLERNQAWAPYIAFLFAMAETTAFLSILIPSTAILVAVGALDVITPPEACAEVAQRKGRPWMDLGPVGHVCALEAAEQVNALLGI